MQGGGTQWCWQELQCRLEQRRDCVWLAPFQPPLPGLDQPDHGDLFSAFTGNADVARETLALRGMVKSMQNSCAALEKVSLAFSLLPCLPSFFPLPLPLLPLSLSLSLSSPSPSPSPSSSVPLSPAFFFPLCLFLHLPLFLPLTPPPFSPSVPSQ